ncbi:MAG TPA: VOC family protein [Kofleriaceae bacterium]|nr:VOC family protein [Kofleriaceae bacterium]
MTTQHSHKIFVNLPVSDLKRSMDFFSHLGFAFNPQFTDDNAACMVLSEDGYVMLLRDEFFKTFTKRGISNAGAQTEAIIALSCESRAEVDEMAQKAIAAGGTQAMDPVDHCFMYSQSFYDPDNHHWEVLWMDPAAIQS